ncbi:acetaldehyde dehydrogenase (acetylating) [Mycolicibacterium goodii]|uniref:Acetaldehyde dehydrogenase n=1 Tax=Mycolicibacterium goodii TaxID=134601 RepID=A0A0K0X3H8_MYCGD|nr:acetaldehyde dehydrogenase [Mycolicibacterium goodii]
MRCTKVAVVGSGNIGTDLMMKIQQASSTLEIAALVGIDPQSDGLARARRSGVQAVDTGVAGLIDLPVFEDIGIVFDATSAKAHVRNAAALAPYGKALIDLTPAALGPYVVPTVNLEQHIDEPNVNMVTCGGQATVPIVAAVARVTPVAYAEIVASISSRSAGPGTRANIDEFTETTARALETVGGAGRGRAIIVLNPADPPLIMRDTVHLLVGEADRDEIRSSVAAMVNEVATYVPGYRLKQEVQFRAVSPGEPPTTLVPDEIAVTQQVSVFLEVAGAGHYLPPYAGNLDIMTSAALRVAERIADRAATRGAAS